MDFLTGISAVAFDIDGTLYPNRAMYRASFWIVLRHFRLFRAFGRARRLVRSDPPEDDLYRRTVEITAAKLRKSVDKTAELVADVIYRCWEEVLERVRLYPEVDHTLTQLQNAGYRLAVLSDFPVGQKLDRFGLVGRWDVALSSEDTGYLKPHPQPFLQLASRLGVPPSQIVYVGNSYRYDVLGARAVGMRTVHLSRRQPVDGVADATVANWRELSRLLFPDSGD